MITANDLRIGNYFLVNWSKEIRKADILDIRDIAENRIIGGVSAIELTPEILIDKGEFTYKPCGISGADMWQGMGFWNIKESDILFRGGFSRTKPIELVLQGYFNTRIKYVHHLQNLYYFLTVGKELKFDLC